MNSIDLVLYKNWNPVTEYRDMIFANKINNPLFLNTNQALDMLKSLTSYREKDIDQYFVNIISESITSFFHYILSREYDPHCMINTGHLYLHIDNISIDKAVYAYIHLALYLVIILESKVKSNDDESVSGFLEYVNGVYNTIMLCLYKNYLPDHTKEINFYRSLINDDIDIDEKFMPQYPWKDGSNKWQNEEGESMHD